MDRKRYHGRKTRSTVRDAREDEEATRRGKTKAAKKTKFGSNMNKVPGNNSTKTSTLFSQLLTGLTSEGDGRGIGGRKKLPIGTFSEIDLWNTAGA